LAQCFPILFEIGSRKVVNLVVLQQGVHFYSRFETKNLRSSAAETKRRR